MFLVHHSKKMESLILSRNLLIYFDKEKKLIVKDIFQKMLKNADGKVYYGHADLF